MDEITIIHNFTQVWPEKSAQKFMYSQTFKYMP